ncbi:hypothetical protein GOBAR_DD27035 [Gossypium barbadense]|nr:hypothetical protein GOBAR_DD27035 [Gossypium barbadense]
MQGFLLMCSGSKSELVPSNFTMEGELQGCKPDALSKCSVLLELAASDDLVAFKTEVEEKGLDLGEASYWYGRRIGSKKMGFEERMPLMIAAMFGSIDVLNYIVGTGKIDVNRASGADGVTALHCAVAGGASSSVQVIKLLLDASADANCVDANGNKPIDLIVPGLKSLSNSKKKVIELLLKGDDVDGGLNLEEESEKTVLKKEYPVDISLPDINNGIYGTDDFRMYTFKVKPCSRAYSHDWTECPFVHPGENARRRDLRKYPYSCVPCPEFRKGACPKGDACEYAHGVFESWLHPAQYRTRLCKDETGCTRKVCFFAHKPDELRPVYPSTGSAMPSPRSSAVNAVDMSTLSPLAVVVVFEISVVRKAMVATSSFVAMMACTVASSFRRREAWGRKTWDKKMVWSSNGVVLGLGKEDEGSMQQQQQQYNIGKGVRERLPPWVEQMYIEQEQMVA